MSTKQEQRVLSLVAELDHMRQRRNELRAGLPAVDDLSPAALESELVTARELAELAEHSIVIRTALEAFNQDHETAPGTLCTSRGHAGAYAGGPTWKRSIR